MSPELEDPIAIKRYEEFLYDKDNGQIIDIANGDQTELADSPEGFESFCDALVELI